MQSKQYINAIHQINPPPFLARGRGYHRRRRLRLHCHRCFPLPQEGGSWPRLLRTSDPWVYACRPKTAARIQEGMISTRDRKKNIYYPLRSRANSTRVKLSYHHPLGRGKQVSTVIDHHKGGGRLAAEKREKPMTRATVPKG